MSGNKLEGPLPAASIRSAAEACFFRVSASLMDQRSLAHRPGFEQAAPYYSEGLSRFALVLPGFAYNHGVRCNERSVCISFFWFRLMSTLAFLLSSQICSTSHQCCQVMLEVNALFPAPLVIDRAVDRLLIPTMRSKCS